MIVVLVPGGDWYVGLVSFSEVVAQPTSRLRTKHSTATLETIRKPLIGSIGLISSPVISQRAGSGSNLAQKSEIGQNGLLDLDGIVWNDTELKTWKFTSWMRKFC
jgi:hypothetical protein